MTCCTLVRDVYNFLEQFPLKGLKVLFFDDLSFVVCVVLSMESEKSCQWAFRLPLSGPELE